jgi:hypothetical protein
LYVTNLSACGSANAASPQMLNTMNLLWAFNFAKDKSGTGNWDIDSYARVNLLYFYNYQPPSYFPSSLALCLLLSHTHAPSLPEMKNGQISSSNHLNTMGNQFKLGISLIVSSIVSATAFAWHTNSFWFYGACLVIRM